MHERIIVVTLSVSLSLCLSICPSVHLSRCLSVCLVCLSVCLSICLFLCLSVCEWLISKNTDYSTSKWHELILDNHLSPFNLPLFFEILPYAQEKVMFEHALVHTHKFTKYSVITKPLYYFLALPLSSATSGETSVVKLFTAVSSCWPALL